MYPTVNYLKLFYEHHLVQYAVTRVERKARALGCHDRMGHVGSMDSLCNNRHPAPPTVGECVLIR